MEHLAGPGSALCGWAAGCADLRDAPLTKPLRLSGAPEVHLYASTSGTDSDWAVKLIDVYPGQIPTDPSMGGYELPISTDIFRGRYRTSFEHPEADHARIKPLLYQFGLPMVNHVFEPGHRIMVQVQSTLFPALRPQSADFRAEHLRCQTRRLPEGNAARLAHARRRELHQPAGGTDEVETRPAHCQSANMLTTFPVL